MGDSSIANVENHRQKKVKNHDRGLRLPEQDIKKFRAIMRESEDENGESKIVLLDGNNTREIGTEARLGRISAGRTRLASLAPTSRSAEQKNRSIPCCEHHILS